MSTFVLVEEGNPSFIDTIDGSGAIGYNTET